MSWALIVLACLGGQCARFALPVPDCARGAVQAFAVWHEAYPDWRVREVACVVEREA